jgi:hypothetical protein
MLGRKHVVSIRSKLRTGSKTRITSYRPECSNMRLNLWRQHNGSCLRPVLTFKTSPLLRLYSLSRLKTSYKQHSAKGYRWHCQTLGYCRSRDVALQMNLAVQNKIPCGTALVWLLWFRKRLARIWRLRVWEGTDRWRGQSTADCVSFKSWSSVFDCWQFKYQQTSTRNSKRVLRLRVKALWCVPATLPNDVAVRLNWKFM